MAKTKEIHTSEMPIDQKKPVDLESLDARHREPEVVKATAGAMNKEYMDELAFNEEPVTILISPSNEKNAPPSYPVWNNGKGAEVRINGKWVELTYLPVNKILTTKRKYVGELLRAKVDRVETLVPNAGSDDLEKFPGGQLLRFTSGLCTFSIIEDKNPRGPEWAMRMRQQQF